MPAQTLEERVAILEKEVANLKNSPAEHTPKPWWEEIRGVFKNDPAYEEAMRYGREWRESQQMEYEDEDQENTP
jgi:hypothetical protein